MKKFLLFANGERYQLLAVVVCVALLVWGVSCEPRVPSLPTPSTKVTRNELQAEVDLLLAKAGSRFKSLDQQDAFKVLLFDQAAVISQTGTFNLAGVIPLIASILGVAAIADNVTKRKEIKKLNGKTP